MEEKKEQKKLTYEELSQAASDLHVQYQKLLVAYQKAMAALDNKELDQLSFFLSMLFKVMEHTEEYDAGFVSWVKDNVQSALISYAESVKPKEAEGDGETE